MKKIKKKMLAIAIGTAIIGTTTLSACKSNSGLNSSFFDPFPLFPLFWLKKRQDQKVEKVIIPCKIKDLQKDFLVKSGFRIEKWEILDDKGAEIVLADPNSSQKIQYNCIQTADNLTECVGKIYKK